MSRPKLTDELISATAAAFCERNGWDAGKAADLARVCRSAHMDGYELAKVLDRMCGWIPTAQDVETLDEFGCDLREALRQACIAWARDNNVRPPLPVGTMTTQGEITGIYAYDGACYEIRKPGDTNATRRLIVRFEDAREASLSKRKLEGDTMSFENEIAKRNAALIALDMEYARRAIPNASNDGDLLAAMHKARYECLDLPESCRHESAEWLRQQRTGRMTGDPLLPAGELPK